MNKKLILICMAWLLITSTIAYCFYVKSAIRLKSSMPKEFAHSDFNVSFSNGMTSLTLDNETVEPIIHDTNGNLHILNGAGHDFKMYSLFSSYYIDTLKGEIVVRKNIINSNQRGKPYFQIIKIPEDKYKPIKTNNKIKVRIQYIQQQYELIEYDFNTQDFYTIDSVLVGK